MVALLSGTTSAFNAFSEMFQTDNQLSDIQLGLISGLGLLGVYFTVPVGFAFDRWGAVKLGVSSTLITAGAYVAMSFVPAGGNWWILLLFCYLLVSFGSGGSFMSALGTSLLISPTGGGFPVAIVSAAMSLSVAFTIESTIKIYGPVTNCTENSCWRNYFRLIAIGQILIELPGALLLLFFKKSDYPHLNKEVKINEDEETFLLEPHEPPKSTGMLQPFKIFGRLYFWVLFWAYFVGMASSLIVVTQANQIWSSYTSSSEMAFWSAYIVVIFSVSNATSNVLCGTISGYLSRKNYLNHSTFVAFVFLLFAVIYSLIGSLFLIPHEENPTAFVAMLLGSTGLGFGCYLVLFPIIVSDTFGPADFGKNFGFLQISSSIASIAVPQIINGLKARNGHYLTSIFGIAALLVSGAAALLLVPKQRTSIPLKDFSNEY